MNVSLDKLTAEALALVGRIGQHASDEAEQHAVMIDGLKAALKERNGQCFVLERELAALRQELAEVNDDMARALPAVSVELLENRRNAEREWREAQVAQPPAPTPPKGFVIIDITSDVPRWKHRTCGWTDRLEDAFINDMAMSAQRFIEANPGTAVVSLDMARSIVAGNTTVHVVTAEAPAATLPEGFVIVDIVSTTPRWLDDDGEWTPTLGAACVFASSLATRPYTQLNPGTAVVSLALARGIVAGNARFDLELHAKAPVTDGSRYAGAESKGFVILRSDGSGHSFYDKGGRYCSTLVDAYVFKTDLVSASFIPPGAAVVSLDQARAIIAKDAAATVTP